MVQDIISILLGLLQRIPIVIANWFILYYYQLLLVARNLTEPSIRNRALQCLVPPTLLLIISGALLALTIQNPRRITRTTRHVIRIAPAIPWIAAAIGVACFAIIARPALWDHQCNNEPIHINPSDRAQWQEIWLDLNKPYPEEPARQFRMRMEKELDTWADRELDADDLEEWVNLSAQAIAKKNCLSQKDEIFRKSVAATKLRWTIILSDWWRKTVLKDYWNAITIQAEICRLDPKSSRWATIMRRARQLNIKS